MNAANGAEEERLYEQLPASRGEDWQERIGAAIRAADLRDAAAVARSSASWKRGQAAQLRYESALLRGVDTDPTADHNDRQCELEDRNAEAIDNVWNSRDGDASANDRALLNELAGPSSDGGQQD